MKRIAFLHMMSVLRMSRAPLWAYTACTGTNLSLYLHIVWYMWDCLCCMKFCDDCFLPSVNLQSLCKLCYCTFLALSLFFLTQWSYRSVVHEIIMKDMQVLHFLMYGQNTVLFAREGGYTECQDVDMRTSHAI
jgi:hypothetical protein